VRQTLEEVAMLKTLGGAVLVCAFAATARASVAPTEGSLTAKDGSETVDVPLRHTEVTIRVSGIVADVEVAQTFVNPYKKKIDATYLFPLPTGAAVHDLAITTGGHTITGKLVKRDEAAEKYRLARQSGHVAALLTEERPNLFTQSVANIEPGARVDVVMRFAWALAWSDGGYGLAFPLVAGPRHVPASSKLTAEAAAALMAPVLPGGMRPRTDVQIRVDVDAGVPIGEVTSPSHELTVERAGNKAHVELAAGDTIPNKDFILRWTVAGAAPTVAFAASDKSFVLVAQPPAGVTASTAAPKQVLFVVDTSSSMAGAPLDKARSAILGAIAHLGPDDTFQILRFDDGSSALGPRALARAPQNLKYAIDWLNALQAGGGTDMVAGLDAALAYPRDAGRLHVIAFFTDGFVGNEDEVLGRLDDRLGDARLYSFGVGSAVNRYLLEEMAAIGRGAVEIVRPDEDTTAAVTRFVQRIDRPVLTDIAIDWNGLAVSDVTPARIPDLFAGQPLVVSGRLAGARPATVFVTGRRGGEPVRIPIALQPSGERRPEIDWLWARARIAELSRQELRGEKKDVEAEITRLALAHNLVTRYTAFVAVDPTRVTAGGPGATIPVAVNVPDGVDRDRGEGRMGYGAGSGAVYGTVGHGSGGGGAYALKVAEPAMAAELERESVPARAPSILVAKAAPPPPPTRLDDAARAALRKCWLDSGGRGDAELHIRVLTGAGGEVTSVKLADASDKLDACVAERAKSWSFAPKAIFDFIVAVTEKEATP
jgi:Ca-activated chloride channel homolog